MLRIGVGSINVDVVSREFAEDVGHRHVSLVKELDLVWLWPSHYPQPWEKIWECLGLDPAKIDYAVPQPWLNEQYEKYGVDSWRVHAFWSYNNNPFFGEPIYQKQLVDDFTKLVLENFKQVVQEWIADYS